MVICFALRVLTTLSNPIFTVSMPTISLLTSHWNTNWPPLAVILVILNLSFFGTFMDNHFGIDDLFILWDLIFSYPK